MKSVFGFFSASVLVLNVLTGLSAHAEDEAAVNFGFSVTNQETGRLELHPMLWLYYRVQLSEVLRNQNEQLTQLAELASATGPIVISAERIDEHTRRSLDAYLSGKTVIRDKLEGMSQTRGKIRDEFIAAVAEAKRLCAQTTSWSCSPTDDQFLTSCLGSTNETCSVLNEFSAGEATIRSIIKYYEDLIRDVSDEIKNVFR